jgi:hypothetical protein
MNNEHVKKWIEKLQNCKIIQLRRIFLLFGNETKAKQEPITTVAKPQPFHATPQERNLAHRVAQPSRDRVACPAYISNSTKSMKNRSWRVFFPRSMKPN